MNIKTYFHKSKKGILIFLSGVFVSFMSIAIFFLITTKEESKNIKIETKSVEKSIKKASGKAEENEIKQEGLEKNRVQNHANENNANSNSSTSKDKVEESITSRDSDVVNYFLEQERFATGREQDVSLRERLKNGVNIMYQFLFHGGTICGKTFKELSSSAKLQVLKIALSIDSKIDEYFPNYKENIKQGASNLKAKVIVTYLETTNKICTNYEDICGQAREEFKTMKNSFKISFSLIAGLAKEGGTAIKEWYLSTK